MSASSSAAPNLAGPAGACVAIPRPLLVRRPFLLARLGLLDHLVNVLRDLVDVGGDLVGDVPDVADGRSPRLPGLVERMATLVCGGRGCLDLLSGRARVRVMLAAHDVRGAGDLVAADPQAALHVTVVPPEDRVCPPRAG